MLSFNTRTCSAGVAGAQTWALATSRGDPCPAPGGPPASPPRTNGAGHRAGPPRGTRARSPAPSATLGGSSLPALPLTRDLPQGGQRPPPPSPLWRPWGRGRLCYQVPVYAAEECVGLDVGESGLRPAAEPLFGVLGISVQRGQVSRERACLPRFEGP